MSAGGAGVGIERGRPSTPPPAGRSTGASVLITGDASRGIGRHGLRQLSGLRTADEHHLEYAPARRGRHRLAQLREEPSHCDVLCEDVDDESLKAAAFGGLHHATGELGAHTLALAVVSHDHRHLADRPVHSREIPDPDDFGAPLRVALRDERDPFAVVGRRQQAQDGVRHRRRGEEAAIPCVGAQPRAELADRAGFARPQRTDAKAA